jgi:hypothetical protein
MSELKTLSDYILSAVKFSDTLRLAPDDSVWLAQGDTSLKRVIPGARERVSLVFSGVSFTIGAKGSRKISVEMVRFSHSISCHLINDPRSLPLSQGVRGETTRLPPVTAQIPERQVLSLTAQPRRTMHGPPLAATGSRPEMLQDNR